MIIDESTDISQEKLLAVCIRYFSKSNCKIISSFLGFVILKGECTSDVIGNGIVEMLQKYKLSLKKLIGIGVDGCSTMVGTNHSVSTYFKKIVPDIVMFKCICHSLQLAASKASSVLPAHIDFLVRESYNWFAHSTKRLCDYNELHMKLADEVTLMLLQLSATRWMSCNECVRRILNQWNVLQKFFHQAALEEKCYWMKCIRTRRILFT